MLLCPLGFRMTLMPLSLRTVIACGCKPGNFTSCTPSGCTVFEELSLRILSLIISINTVKKVSGFPVPSWDVTYRLGMGKWLNFFYSVRVNCSSHQSPHLSAFPLVSTCLHSVYSKCILGSVHLTLWLVI